MSARVRVDERGRITLPKEVREALNIMPGDELVISVLENKLVVEKGLDPFKELGRLLGDLSFNRRIRVEAEQAAVKEVLARRG